MAMSDRGSVRIRHRHKSYMDCTWQESAGTTVVHAGNAPTHLLTQAQGLVLDVLAGRDQLIALTYSSTGRRKESLLVDVVYYIDTGPLCLVNVRRQSRSVIVNSGLGPC